MKHVLRACLVLILSVSSLYAAERPRYDMTDFSRIPVLHEGRIKPLDSLARHVLHDLTGKKNFQNQSPSAWLAGILFDPAQADTQKLFTSPSPRVSATLGLQGGENARYTFPELARAFDQHSAIMADIFKKPSDVLNEDEAHLLALYEQFDQFAQLKNSLSMLRPMAGDKTYLELQKDRQMMLTRLKALVAEKGENIDSYTDSELSLADLSRRLDIMDTTALSNTLLRIIPPAWNAQTAWLTPWMVVTSGQGAPQSKALFDTWELLALAYMGNDVEAWERLSAQLYAETSPHVRPWALTLEGAYNHLSPYTLALAAYGVCAFLFLFMLIYPGREGFIKLVYGLLASAVFIHAAALISRMAILVRPPVSTLYESLIFVSLIAGIIGLWSAHKRRSPETLLAASGIAAFLLALSGTFADGDTLEVLVAVLNTNFWLATHVICITAGYGAAIFAGTLAHLWLAKRALMPKEDLTLLYRQLYRISLFALLLTAIGTMLGGIWADQSWGRFWGWDPKENGALLIVLWLIWILHGRAANILNAIGFCAALALLNIIVALSWIGVNLLGVGLHSYGFTEAAATGLLAFCTVEIVIIGGLTLYICRKKQ